MSKHSVIKKNGLVLSYPGMEKCKDSKTDPVWIGAVYYRRSNPPESDWERDYETAANDGMNIFRHWFLWGAINYAPGKYNWEPYDRQLELAEKNGIKTVIAEFIIDVPEWLYYSYPHARREHYTEHKFISRMHVSCATGGHQAMCLDNPEVKEAAEEFLIRLAERYKNHPAVLGYDIWNECSMYTPDNLCYCPATQESFRQWLRKKYNNNLDTLNRTWRRYSYTAWEQVQLPREVKPYPENLDAIEFYNDNAIEWMQWRADILSKHDPNHFIIAHGNAKSFSDIAPAAGDDWRAAEVSDIFGYTYWYSNNCSRLLAADMIRSAAKGKEFWRAEAIGNSDWENRSVHDEYHAEKDEMSYPENIRLDSMISFMGGARCFMNPRWRSLQDGPLFGGYGWYGLDGSRTERSQMMASIAKWANDNNQRELWNAMPVKGEVGVILLEEAQANCYVFTGSTDYYSFCIQGCYEAFTDSNIQCDIIKLDQISGYSVVYVPYPVGLKDSTISILREWVKEGGFLICEGCPGYFDGHGHALAKQLNRGLEEVFGCIEQDVSFAPDRWKNLSLKTLKGAVKGGIYRQVYKPTTGEVWGTCDDGVAIVKNAYGKGYGMVIGTMPGYAYRTAPDEQTRRFYASLLEEAGKKPLLSVPNNTGIIARICADKEITVLWVVNTTGMAQRVRVYMDKETFCFNEAQPYRGKVCSVYGNSEIEVEVGGKDAAVIKLINDI